MATLTENSSDGTTWERYRLQGLLGSGGGGSVHRALDRWTGDPVAIKRYQAGVPVEAAHEASLLGEIRFPGVVRLRDCTTDLDGAFLAVFELLEGRDFRAATAGLPFDETVELFADVLRALAFVHRRGIVHRDLKPENILVGERGGAPRATVIDFGLAVERRDPETSVGGTLAYLAPEVLEGAASDARSDLFAMGVLLYEVIAGRRPSEGLSGVDVVRLHTSRDLRLEPEVARRVAPGVSDLVRTLLRRDPALRFGSAVEVLEALSRASDRDLPLETEETLHGAVRSLEFPMPGEFFDRACEVGAGGLTLTLPPGSLGYLARLRVAWAAAGRRVFHVRVGAGVVPALEGLPEVGAAGGVLVLSCHGHLDGRGEEFVRALLRAVETRHDLAMVLMTEDDGPLPTMLAEAALPRLDLPRPDDAQVRALAEESLSLELDERALRRLRVASDISPLSMTDGLALAIRQGILGAAGDRPRWNEVRRLDRAAPASSLEGARQSIDALSEEERRLAGVLAVSPLALPLEVVEDVGGAPDAVRALESKGLVRADAEGRLGLASDALALVAMEDLAPDVRRQAARVVADRLAREGASDAERLGEAGRLLVEELDDAERGRAALLEAGVQLRTAGRSGAARRYLERCLPLCPADVEPATRLRVLRWLADCDSIEGRNDDAERRLAEAVTLPGAAEDRGSAYAVLARTRLRTGDLADADRTVDVGLAVEGISGPTRALLLTTRSMIRRNLQDMEGAADAAREALDAAGDAKTAERGAALMTLANACAYLGEVEEAVDTYHAAEELGRELGRADMTALAAANIGRLLHAHGRASEAVAALSPILETFERDGEARHAENLLQTLMAAKNVLGDVAGVRALALKGRSLFGAQSSRQNRAMFVRHVADAELRAGNPGEAARLADESLSIREEVGEVGLLAVGLALRARVETWQGAFDAARATLARALRLLRRGIPEEQQEEVFSSVAALHLSEGPLRLRTARRAAARAMEAARGVRPPRTLPRAAALAVEAAVDLGEFPRLERLVDEILDRVGQPFEDPSLPVMRAARQLARASHAPTEELSIGFERALEHLAAEGHGAERALVLSWRARARVIWARRQNEEVTRSGTIRIAAALSRARSDLEDSRALYESLGRSPPASRLDAIERDLGSLDPAGADRTASTGLMRHFDSLQRLHEVNKVIHAEHEPARLLNLVLDEAIDLCGARRGFLILVRGTQIDVRVARNFAEQDIQHPEFQFSHSVARQVAMSGDPIRSSDALRDPGLRSIASIAELRVTSILCVPLRARDQVIGSIYLDHPDVIDRFDDDDLEVLTDFAAAAGMALERARLYQENVERTTALESAKHEIERLNAALMKTVAEQAEELDHTKDSLEAERRAAGRRYDYQNIVTQSERMEEVLHLVDRITETDFPVLVQGESGTGKELIARAVHYNGPRARQNFVSVNCAAMAEPLIEAELFGSMRGAFTGADRDRKGLFEIAHGGTLFLDEIGDMSLEVQKRLLRVVQYGEFFRLGGKEKVKVDVRFISATHRDLKQLIAGGQFREDLYYRVNVAPVHLPPVRERPGDVPLLLRHFAEELERSGLSLTRRFSPAALEALEAYSWPGNVRELQNVIKRLLFLETGRPVIEVEDLPAAIRDRATSGAGDGAKATLRERLDRHEKQIIEATLEQVGGNKAEAARRLGVSERGLYKILDRLGISRSTGRSSGATSGKARVSARRRGRSGAQDSADPRR